MKKTVALSVLLALFGLAAGPSFAAPATAPRPRVSTGPKRIASAGEDLIELLPRSTIGVVVINLKRALMIDALGEAMQELKVKAAYDEFIEMSGIDLKKDGAYIGIGVPAPDGAGPFSLSTAGGNSPKFGIIIDLKYDQVRLRGLIKEKAPAAKEEAYEGMTIYSNLDGGDTQATPSGPNVTGKLGFQVAFLDASRIVLGNDGQSIKSIIDVYRKKAEPLAKNPGMAALMKQVDRSGLAWAVFSVPPELIKKALDANPLLKSLEGLTGVTAAFDEKASMLTADIRAIGGTEEQNAVTATNLNGLRAVGTLAAAQLPALAELLNGVAITSGKNFTRMTLTASPETVARLNRLIEMQARALQPASPGAGSEWQALNSEVDKLIREGHYERALETATKARELAEKNAGPDHLDVATSLNGLALSYDALGQSEEAEPLYQRALAIREKALGPDHPDVATSLNNLAECFRAQAQFTEAEPLFERALAIQEKAFGPEYSEVATILNNLALLNVDQGRYAEAEPLFKRSLAIWEKTFGTEHPNVALCLSNIGLLRTEQGQYAEAEPLYRRSLAIREKTVGPDHPDVAQSLDNLAYLCLVQGRGAEAEPLYKRSLEIKEKTFGPDHPVVAASLDNLALVCYSLGLYAEAEPLYARLLAIREKDPGPDDPGVAEILEKLGGLYRAQLRYAEAEPLYKRAVAIREKAAGPDHPDVAMVLNMQALLYHEQDRYAEAEPIYRRALAILEKANGPDHPDLAPVLDNHAFLYYEQGQYEEAEGLYKRSLAILEKANGPDHPDVATGLNHLGELYRAMGRHAEAEPVYMRAAGPPGEGPRPGAYRRGRGPDRPGASLLRAGPVRTGGAILQTRPGDPGEGLWSGSPPTGDEPPISGYDRILPGPLQGSGAAPQALAGACGENPRSGSCRSGGLSERRGGALSGDQPGKGSRRARSPGRPHPVQQAQGRAARAGSFMTSPNAPESPLAASLGHFQSVYDRHRFLDLYALTSEYWTDATDVNSLPVEAIVVGALTTEARRDETVLPGRTISFAVKGYGKLDFATARAWVSYAVEVK